jgi:hypothetical protein
MRVEMLASRRVGLPHSIGKVHQDEEDTLPITAFFRRNSPERGVTSYRVAYQLMVTVGVWMRPSRG